MKRMQCFYALAAAIGCAVPSIAVSEDASRPARPPVVQLASNLGWDEDRTSSQEQPPAPPPDDGAAVPAAPNPSPTKAFTEGPSSCQAATSCGCGSCGGGSSCGCGAGGCNNGCNYDPNCDRPCSMIALVEATFFWPQFHRNFLTSNYTNPNSSANLISNTALGSTDGSMLVAPRITFGFQGECWGLVGRYWNATNWATGGFTPAIPVTNGVGIANFDGFKAYTADLEVQRRFSPGAWNMYGFFGVRYASLNNDRSLNVTTLNGITDANTLTTAFTSQQFNGTGLTFGFWGNRPLCCDSPFSLFFANRYSILWGQGIATSQTSAQVGLLGTSTNGAAATNPGDLFIAELQVGGQWNAALKCFPSTAFVRTAFEWQYWGVNSGVRASSNSFVSAPLASASTSTSAGDMIFNLIGFNIGAGIMF
ncbi:MAG TPA: hypothetical protein VHV08_11810 [Pirellulales bacterium]|nr:hypothetical protein [Pirellulales bacterium]